jgi:hypothetical protein
MKKKTMVCAVCLLVLVAACAILFFSGKLSWGGRSGLPAPWPDAIATGTVSASAVFIEDKTAGYAITVPKGWYLEKSSGSGMTIYPDYDAAGKKQPDCKMEISTLPNPDRKNITDWLSAYLRGDPTADIFERGRATTTVGGAPAIIWDGALNGISSTLAYIATGTEVYEIAPSMTYAGELGSADIDCKNALRTILKNFSL